MKLTLPRLFAAFFVLALVASYPIAVYAEDGQPDSQVSRQLHAPQGLFAQAATAPAIPECEIAHNCPTAPAATVTVSTAPATGTDFTATVSSLAQIIIAVVGALLAWPLSKFFGTQNNATEILNDVGMGKYASYAAELAVKWALQATGASVTDLHNVEIRGGLIGYAAQFLNRQFPEVVKWVLTSGKLSEFIEAHMPPVPGTATLVSAGTTPKPA